jgi:exodeoxyribonuclease-3
MRVLTWNILNGGADARGPGRLDRILSVIGEQRPDIAVLQEAKHFELDGHRPVFLMENTLGMRGVLAEAQTHQHVLLLIRKDIELLDCHVDSRSFHHALVRVRLRLAEGTELRVLGTHLCPHGALNRLLEAQRLTNYARAEEFVLLMGDLNSVDHHGRYANAVAALPAHYRARYVLPGTRDEPDTRVTATLEAAGFVDVPHTFGQGADRPTAPTELTSAGGEFDGMRVDYIYASERLAGLVTGARVLMTDTTATASDHYPVVAEFAL